MFKTFGSLDDSIIVELESKVDMQFPIEYKQFLKQTNGGTFEEFNNNFEIDSNNEIIEMDVMYGVRKERSLNLLDWFNEYKLELPKNSMIIGCTLGAGLILMVWDSEDEGIYLWDDSLELSTSTEEECIYKIAKDFNTFKKLVKII